MKPMPNNRIKTTFMLNGVDLIFDNILSVSFELLVIFGFERKKKNAYVALKNKADNVYKNENFVQTGDRCGGAFRHCRLCGTF